MENPPRKVGQLNRFNLGDQFRPGLDSLLGFGKYTHLTIREAIDSDTDYMKWVVSPSGGGKVFNHQAMEYLEMNILAEEVGKTIVSTSDLDPGIHNDLPF